MCTWFFRPAYIFSKNNPTSVTSPKEIGFANTNADQIYNYTYVYLDFYFLSLGSNWLVAKSWRWENNLEADERPPFSPFIEGKL